MTPHEKAIAAINARIERVQASLHQVKDEAAQQFLAQSLVVTIGMAEALSDYAKQVGVYAQRRHAEVKQANEALGMQHTDLLKSGQELLERLKANPTDQTLRKEIERLKRAMEAVQKSVRRGANALQRDLAPSLAQIDPMAEGIKRLSEAGDSAALKRLLKTVVDQVRQLYAAQPGLPARGIVDAVAWEKSALAEIDQAAGFDDAYARAGHQAVLALEWMTLAVAERPPAGAAEASQRANEAVAARIKAITERFTNT